MSQPTRLTGAHVSWTGLLIAISVLVAIAGFNGALQEQVRRWIAQDEYSHGFFIPLIVLWLLWARRDALRASIGRPSWMGLVVILFAAFMHIVGELSALFFFSQVGFVLALLGIVLGAGGYSLLKVTFIPIVFLLFAIPTPYFIDSDLSWRLQLISSQLGVFVIRMFQIPVYLAGNIIDLGQYKLQVVEACSGLRYLYPLLSLGFLAAYLFQAPLWQRIVVFLSTIPITIVMNSFRIGMIGVLVDRWGIQMADGFLHFFEGWIIFIACAGLLAAEIYLFARIGAGKGFFQVFYLPKISASQPRHPVFLSGGQRPMLACLLFLCVTGLGIFYISGRQEIVPERTRFVAFPSQLGSWQGRPSLLEPQEEHALNLEDYILSNYSKPAGGSINFYVAYYASQRKGSSPHSPLVCLPGGGWVISKFERTSYSNDAAKVTLPLNRAVMEYGSSKQLVYYWFVQRGRKVANEYWSKWYLLVDAIFMNRTDGALVRLITTINSNESESDADARLQSFILDLEPSLKAFLPAESAPQVKSVQYRPQG
jgi:exosortase D (VPLPA-CTERM-specific)